MRQPFNRNRARQEIAKGKRAARTAKILEPGVRVQRAVDRASEATVKFFGRVGHSVGRPSEVFPFTPPSQEEKAKRLSEERRRGHTTRPAPQPKREPKVEGSYTYRGKKRKV